MNPKHYDQMQLDFDPGLSEMYPTVLDCLNTCARSVVKEGRKIPLKSVASEMDLSASDLTRKLANNPDDPRKFTVLDLEAYVSATGDTTPILYLAQKYCVDNSFKKDAAINALVSMVPQLTALLETATKG